MIFASEQIIKGILKGLSELHKLNIAIAKAGTCGYW